MTSVLIVDTKFRGRALGEVFHKAGGDVFWFDGDKASRPPHFLDSINLPRTFDLLLLHENDRDVWESVVDADLRALSVVCYTGNPLDPTSTDPRPGEELIYQEVSANHLLTQEQAMSLLAWASAPREGTHPQPPEILRKPAPHLMSLLLSCHLLITCRMPVPPELWRVTCEEYARHRRLAPNAPELTSTSTGDAIRFLDVGW